jgi:hypothetical protein
LYECVCDQRQSSVSLPLFVIKKMPFMKWLSLLFITVLTTVFACKKDRDHSSIASLNGQWKMVQVKEKATGVITTKPSSLNGDVSVTFAAQTDSSGSITGHTPTNILSGGYTIYPGKGIHIPAVLASKVMETPWGSLFIDHVTTAQTYHVECNELRLNTANVTLFFQKQ